MSVIMIMCWRVVLSFFALLSLGQGVFGYLADDLAETIQLCCNQGTAYARNHTSEDCSSSIPPADVPSDYGPLCILAMDKCCREYFQKKRDCDSGIDIATSTSRCDGTGDTAKSCCRECEKGTTLASSAGARVCDVKIRGNSAEELLSGDAFKQCCKRAVKEERDTDNRRNNKQASSSRSSTGSTVASLCEEYAPNELCAHHCIPVPGSYKCECNPGFMLMADGRNCKEVVKNRCKPRNPCQHKCNDNGLEVKCSCRRGYQLMADKKSCEDIDECLLSPPVCLSGTRCSNVQGSYKCIPMKKTSYNNVEKGNCPPGFSWNNNNNACDDINECRLPHPPCPSYLCENSVGGYKCGGVSGDPANLDNNRPPADDRCPPGFRSGTNEECEDVDECALHKDDCNPLSQFCINTRGNFYCQNKASKQCPPGFKIDPRTNKCEDIDECEDGQDICRPDQVCINVPGEYNCRQRNEQRQRPTAHQCPDGMRVQPGNNNACEDIDECAEGTHLCDQYQRCLNTNGSHECHCKLGFELDSTTGACIDVNECATDQHDCITGSQRCDNTVGSFLCIRFTSCGTGYILHHSTSQCEDIDECALGTHNCARAGPEYQCENHPGSFRCVRKHRSTTSTTAQPEYEYEYYDSEEEVNQTKQAETQPKTEQESTTTTTFKPEPPSETPPTTPSIRPTEVASRAVNLQPNPENRQPDRIDDRLNNIEPSESQPDYNQRRQSDPTTNNGQGLPDQAIPPEKPQEPEKPPNEPEQHEPKPTEPSTYYYEPRQPEPPRQPEQHRHPEQEQTRQSEQPRKPEQEQTKQPEKPNPTETTQLNTNESIQPDIEPKQPEITNRQQEQESSPIPPHVVYVDVGRETATVQGEKKEDGSVVVDTQDVPKNEWTKVNEKPSNCQTGFELDDYGACVDIDECATNHHSCSGLTEVCRNKMGGYLCDCAPGFRRVLSGACDMTTTPSTTSTSTTPSPPTVASTERDEYLFGSRQYRPTSRPFRTRNLCDVGFHHNSKTRKCEDVNECINGQANCAAVEICVNTEGGYRCECPPNWRLDEIRHRCLPIRSQGQFPPGYGNEPVYPPANRDDGQHQTFNGNKFVEPEVTQVADRGSVIKCPGGYKLGYDNSCEDIDECSTGQAICGVMLCTNLPGGYVCGCPAGHKLVGGNRCEDVDECTLGGNMPVCSQNADCVNTIGSYQCQCHNGFRPAPMNEKVCVDVDECTDSPSGSLCQQRCNNVWGGYRCSCHRGYRLNLDNRTCADVDECTEFKSRIVCVGRCVNEPGSYQCTCPPGYRLSEDHRSCIDIDECETGEAHCAKGNTFGGTSEVCVNTRGGYRCHHIMCPSGYKLESKHRCTRIEKNCPPADWDCAHQPTTYSYNFITFVSHLYIPTERVDLFTMKGPAWPMAKMKFALRLLNVDAPPTVKVKADINTFLLVQTGNQAVMSLVQSLEGPQSIELELSMELYNGEQFGGIAVAKLYIFVSEYEF